jgi:hexosaminidase
LIVPRPAEVTLSGGALRIGNTAPLVADADSRASAKEISERLAAHGWRGDARDDAPTAGAAIVLRVLPDPRRAESYSLIVDQTHVTITGADAAGLSYGLETLLQLLPDTINARTTLPRVTIRNAPRFVWRGLTIDTARHFMPPELLHQVIDEMARLKLNRLHLSLTDDQGWRFSVPECLRLSEVASSRPTTLIGHRYERPQIFDGEPQAGLYSETEIAALVAHARRRQIMIVPGVNAPRHITAALAAYPEFSAGPPPTSVESRWGVFETLLASTPEAGRFVATATMREMKLFPGSFVHLGGDEVILTRWRSEPAAVAFRQSRGLPDERVQLAAFLARRARDALAAGRTPIFWDDALEAGAPKDSVIMAWRAASATQAALAAGHRVVIADFGYLYFDYAQAVGPSQPQGLGPITPIRKTFDFDQTAGLEAAQNVLGVQAALWTEYVPDANAAQRMLFARLAAFAEVAWTPQASRSWPDFAGRLHRVTERQKQAGLAPSNAVHAVEAAPASHKAIVLSSQIPPATIRCTRNGSRAAAHGPAATAPIPIDRRTRLRAAAFDANGTMLGPILEADIDPHLAFGRPLRFGVAPDRRYFPSPETLLVDDRNGGSLLSGGWQSFIGKRDVTIDLERPTALRTIGVAFGSLPEAGVRPPETVEVTTSLDGTTLSSPIELTAGPLDAVPGGRLRNECQREFSGALPRITARYVRLMARSAALVAADEVRICWPEL